MSPIVFVLFETILSRSFCLHLPNSNKRIQTSEGCILNVWKYIRNEAIQVRNYYQWGRGWGSIIKGVNRACRTLEYSLYARSFTHLGKKSFFAFLGYISQKIHACLELHNRQPCLDCKHRLSSKHLYWSRTSIL